MDSRANTRHYGRQPEIKRHTFRRAGAVLAATTFLLIATPQGRSQSLPEFTSDEKQSILSHGPWPMPWRPDLSNRVSGNPRAASLGRKLFFDEKLSRFGALSCATCHQPDRAWGDGRSQASSAARLERNTLPLYNLRHAKWFGWDGASDSLWLHSLRPILDPREMASSPKHVATRISSDRALAAEYARVFGAPSTSNAPDAVLVNVAKALAAFQETIVTMRAPFDDFRDALARDDYAALQRYPTAAARGLKLFVGKAGCNTCHSGPLFTNGTFRNIAVPPLANIKTADSGRFSGLRRLTESPFDRYRNQLGDQRRQSTKPPPAAAPIESNIGEFKVPSLRNVALTGPYMHNGSKSTLIDAVSHYAAADTQNGAPSQQPHRRSLNVDEIADLAAFLETLTETTSPTPKGINPPR